MYRPLTAAGLSSTEGALSLDHLKTSQLKLLLQTEGLSMEGPRDELLVRLKGHLVATLPCEWVMTALEGDGPHREYATVVSHGGDMYLFGGDCHHRMSGQTGAMNAVMKYNTFRGRWEAVACKGAPPCERSGHSAVVHKGKMWVFGGWKWIVTGATGRMFNDMYCFDFRGKRWSEVQQKGDVPEPRAWHSVWVHDGAMLVYGDNGECEESKEMVGTVLAFDFDTCSWSQICGTGDAPVPEQVEGICVHNEVLYCLCYTKAADDDAGMEVFAMDMAVQRWARIAVAGERPSARIGCSTTFVGGMWVLHGGFPMQGAGEILGDTYSFDLETKQWTLVRCRGDAPLPRGGHTAVALGTSIVFLEGSTLHASGRSSRFHDVQYCSIIEQLWRQPQAPAGDAMLNSDMLCGVRRLYGDDELKDCTLRVGGRTFTAHRVLLAASSPVFDRMFRHRLQESETCEVSIPDVSASVFESVLRYCYGSLAHVPAADAVELFRAADKYDVEGLRSQCLAVLKEALDVDNLGSFVLLADERNCEELLEAAVEYASSADIFLKVLSSESYLSMIQSNARLGQKFTQFCAQRAFSSCPRALAAGLKSAAAMQTPAAAATAAAVAGALAGAARDCGADGL